MSVTEAEWFRCRYCGTARALHELGSGHRARSLTFPEVPIGLCIAGPTEPVREGQITLAGVPPGLQGVVVSISPLLLNLGFGDESVLFGHNVQIPYHER